MNLPIIGKQYHKRVNISPKASRNALIHLPDDYSTSITKYPLLVFLCGSGETIVGSREKNVTALLRHGPPKMIAEGENFHITNPNTGEIEKFIVLSLQQDSSGYPFSPENVSYVIENDELLKDRVKAIFITGLSLGGVGTAYFFSDQYAETELASITALIPMSAKPLSGSSFNFNKIKELKTPVWAFCGSTDASGFTSFMKKMEQNIPDVKTTWYKGGHCCWTEQYKNKEIYEWCLSKMTPVIPELPEITIEGPPILSSTKIKLDGFILNYIVNA